MASRNLVSLAFSSLLPLSLLATGCGDADAPPSLTEPDGGEDPLFVAVGADTIAPEAVTAGERLMVKCLLEGENGEFVTPTASQVAVVRIDPEDSVMPTDDGDFIAVRSGQVSAACGFRSLSIIDKTPAVIRIDHGPPFAVATVLDKDTMIAGQMFTATCNAVDAYGNSIPDVVPELLASPLEDGNVITENTGIFERSGVYDIACNLPGASTQAARLEVLHDLPASLLVSINPNETVYEVGQVINMTRTVTDRFNNPIDDVPVPVTYSGGGNGQSVGDGNVRFLADGTYTMTATVAPPTQGDIPLSASVQVLVDSSGPAISCENPLNAAIFTQTPGTNIVFQGRVTDLSGVSNVRVNGATVTVAANGSFTRTVTTTFGINFVDIAATDTNGVETTRLCSFLVAGSWVAPAATLANAVSLQMRQAAIDDGTRNSSITSLADLLHGALNSAALRNQLHGALTAANPLKPNACDSQTCTFLGCVCWVRSEVTYQDTRLDGSESVSMSLVNGGIGGNVSITNAQVRLRVRGAIIGIGFDTSGWVTFASLGVGLVFDTYLSGGRPKVSVRPGSVSASVGSISTDFSGLDGAIINLVASIANGLLRDAVRGLVVGFVQNNLNGVLDGILGGLDISNLGATFNVPRLSGGAPIPMTFGVQFSSLSASTARALFGIGTRITAPPAHGRSTLGTPIPAGGVLLDPSTTTPLAVGVHISLLGQALHALWQAGFFDVTMSNAQIPSLPAGFSVQLTTFLPPAAQIVNGRVQLSIGAARLLLTYPALFAQPLDAWLGMRASMRVNLVGNDLSFDDFRIDELRMSTSLDLDTANRDIIEDLLTDVLTRIVSRALNDALPAIPIPTFQLPPWLSDYGLPGGQTLGVTNPALSTLALHFALSGGFGVR
jgi:Glucodextranase, domain B